MAPTNIKTAHQTSSLHIERSLDRLGLLSPTHDQRCQHQSGQISLQPVLINKSKFLKVTHRTKIRKIEIPRSVVVEALSWWSRRASQHSAVQSPVHLWKSPTNLARSPLLVAPVRRKMTVVRHQLSPQKYPGSRLWISRTGVQPSPGSSTIELPSAFAESGAYPPDRALPWSPRQCSLPLACRHPPEVHQIGARKGRTPGNTILSQPCPRRVSTNRPSLEESGPTPAGKTFPHWYSETRFRRERVHEDSTPRDLCLPGWGAAPTADGSGAFEYYARKNYYKPEAWWSTFVRRKRCSEITSLYARLIPRQAIVMCKCTLPTCPRYLLATAGNFHLAPRIIFVISSDVNCLQCCRCHAKRIRKALFLFPSILFCSITVLSLYGKYVVRFPLPDVFLPCDHGLEFYISLLKIQSIITKMPCSDLEPCVYVARIQRRGRYVWC